MTNIDLTPPENLVRRARNISLKKWGNRLGVLAICVIFSYIGVARVAGAKEAQLMRVTGKYTLLQERLRKAENLLTERDHLAQHREAIQLIRNDRTAGWYLQLLGDLLTEESYLTALNLDLCPYSDSNIWGNLNKEECLPNLKIEGHAAGHQQVGKIIGRMNHTGIFREVSLISIQVSPGLGKNTGVDFEIQCSIPTRGADA